MKQIFLLILVAFGLRSYAQCDSCRKNVIFVGIISPNNDNSVYTAMQNIWYANEKISYLCVPYFKNIENPAIPLRDGEGKKGYFFEGNLFYQTPILMGRNHGNHLWQTSRLTFDYGFNIRMALDPSNPLLPNNNIIGLTYDKGIWDSHTHMPFWKRDTTYSFRDWNNRAEPLTNLSMNITAHHYSNGQPPGFFVYDTINGQAYRRNNYLHGDFSTNYLQIGFTLSHLYVSRSLLSFKLAYQRDGQFVGPFAFTPEQKKSYGQDRIKGFLQYKFVWRGKPERRATIASYVCDSGCEKPQVHLMKAYELTARVEYEYIMGDLSLYPHQNKYRFNPHFYLQFTRPNWRALGFVLHFYYGRDYSNIRYDLPVWAIMGGISINMNKYRPPFADVQKYN